MPDSNALHGHSVHAPKCALGSIWRAVRPVRMGSYRLGFWRLLRMFVRDARRGRPCICHECGEPMYAGQWIQRVRVPALPWAMWRHRGGPCGPGTEGKW